MTALAGFPFRAGRLIFVNTRRARAGQTAPSAPRGVPETETEEIDAMFRVPALFVALALLAACEGPQSNYPVSGEECAPTDPVQTIDARECTPPA